MSDTPEWDEWMLEQGAASPSGPSPAAARSAERDSAGLDPEHADVPCRGCYEDGYRRGQKDAAASPAAGLDGETMYRAWWLATWDAGQSTHRQWEQLDPYEKAMWEDAAARLSRSGGEALLDEEEWQSFRWNG